MPSVDNRVVRMEFDNAAFERKIQTTLASLKKLDQSLKMQGASKGLQDINTAANKVNVGNATKQLQGVTRGLGDVSKAAKDVNLDTTTISRGIEGVSKGFIAMGAVAVSAISTITTGALQTGLGAAQKAVGAVTDGFSEYETNLNSIQTILANTESKGSTLDDVNGALQQLNTYSDKTIYNFGQMAKNIGTFTAAGIGLEESVAGIKGIAQLAAVSGSNSEQASTAMYQLSQALAAGKLGLQDWNSVVNAGMGGEIFKTRLFETAKAMGTLGDVPLDQSLKAWEKANGPFRESLKDGWVNADVLSTSLATFTGDLSDSELAVKGFTKAQIKQIQASAASATAAATDVKTFTQLMGTVKESIGTGFADSFRLILGNFGEAKVLFSDINRVIGGLVGKIAAARNAVLLQWNKLGGRAAFIQGIISGFVALGVVLKAIKDAFREVFPRKTGKELADISKKFATFMHALIPGKETVLNLKRIFGGLFSILKIGTTIISSIVKLFFRIGKAVAGAGGPGLLGFIANIGDLFTKLREFLVDGGGITDFFNGIFDQFTKLLPAIEAVKDFFRDLFDTLASAFSSLLPYAEDVKNFFSDMFGGVSDKTTSGVTAGVDKVQGGLEKLEPLTERVQNRFENLKDVFGKIGAFFSQIGRAIGDALSAVFDKLGGAFGGGNFNTLLDVLNVGLLGGLVLLFRKFFKTITSEGLKLDFFGGLTKKIGDSFEALTGSLKSLQLKVKSEAIMKIAQAIAVLVASLVVLSLIDSDKLAKALVAMGSALAILVGVLATLQKLDIKGDVMNNMLKLAGAMVIIGVGMIFFAGAARLLGTLDWQEMIQGIGGMAAILGGFVLAVKYMKESSEDLYRVAGSLILLGVSIFFIAKSVQKFASMDWEKLKQGLLGFAISLGTVVTAMRNMPDDMKKKTKGLASFGVAINLVAIAVRQFGTMDMAVFIQGMLGLGLVLAGIVVAFKNMPSDMEKRSVGLVGIAVAVGILALALKIIGSMNLGEMITGLIGMGIAMVLLAAGAHAMQGALAGAAAMLVISAAMLVLAVALKALSSISWGTLVQGLLKIALAIGVFAAVAYALVATGAIGALIALGVALALIGVGFAAIGLGAYAVARAFEVFGRVGPKAFENFEKGIKTFVKILPTIFRGIAEGFFETVKMVLEMAPKLLEGFVKLFTTILDAVIKIIPKFQEVLGALIEAGMATIRTFAAAYIETGFFILTKLLEGISKNIGKIVDLVIDIVTNFANAVIARIPEIVGIGLRVLLALIQGIADNLSRLASAVTGLITRFIKEIANNYNKIITAGFDVLKNFITGIVNNLTEIVTAVGTVLTKFVTELGAQGYKLVTAGADALINFLDGVKSSGPRIVAAFAGAAGAILGSLVTAIATEVPKFADQAVKAFIGFFDAMSKVIDDNAEELGRSMANFAESLFSGFGKVFLGAMKEVIKDALPGGWIGDRIKGAVDEVFEALGIASPSKVFLYLGEMCMLGFAVGIDKNSDLPIKSMQATGSAFTKTLTKISSDLEMTSDFNPVITPVLDLTKVAASSKLINGLLPGQGLSLAHANTIATTPVDNGKSDAEISPVGTSEIKFEQTINSPTQLSTAEIYKQTRNQIRMAKEELKIP